MKIKLQLLIILIFIITTLIFFKTSKKEVIYITSDIDGKNYLVRDLKDKQKAANMLARIYKNIMLLVDHLNTNKDDKYSEYKKYIDQLTNKIKNVIINESSDDGMYTSYSVNKGEQIVFCLRSKKYKNKLHDLNLLMYVTLHEIAHVATPEYGHTPLFKKIFAFLTKVAIDIGLYNKINFESIPLEYCGLMISDSIV